ncbi:SRPBCC family protein [Chitinophaga flava]|uniref:ATPase n=1 Tax=Chitinophaga flava TaxID=2259036 RepID=A0A365XWB1_9BACT|nr:SRPBCC family protein [Chitinophaga flava]RBL89994.1 ATPase [Chitinophaga flava]
MAAKNDSVTASRELVIHRTFDAPRELVFKAWTEPELLIKWWGPKGFTNTFHEIDVRPGGVWRYTMHSAEGQHFENRITYSAVEPPYRLAYLHDSGIDNDPDRFEVDINFEEQHGKTHLTMRSTFLSAEILEKIVKEYGAVEGAHQTLDKLEAALATMQ